MITYNIPYLFHNIKTEFRNVFFHSEDIDSSLKSQMIFKKFCTLMSSTHLVTMVTIIFENNVLLLLFALHQYQI